MMFVVCTMWMRWQRDIDDTKGNEEREREKEKEYGGDTQKKMLANFIHLCNRQ